MFHVKHSINDTIAAIATPAGVGAVGIVRLSGPDSLRIASGLFVSQRSAQAFESHRMYHGWISSSGVRVDEVLLVYMAAPNSYTGEDVVEVSCHGGGLAASKILSLFIKSGARLAEGGEFTKRAFLNGRIDLLRAEAVADMISAGSERGLRAAAAQLGGEISEKVSGVRQELLGLVSGVEAAIDFPDDLEQPGGRGISETLSRQLFIIDELIATADEGRVVRGGVRLAIIGKPNVGKSSLLNRLVDADRAIVSPAPGTTRDTIEESVVIDGLLFVLVDTAGIRGASDDLEAEGVARSVMEIGKADLVMIVLDSSSALSPEDERVLAQGLGKRALLAINKTDLGSRLVLGGDCERVDKFFVSALTGEGVRELRGGLVSAVLGRRDAAEAPPAGLINARHKEALERAREALLRASDALSGGQPLDLLTIDLRGAISALGEMTGQDVTDEIVDNIFSNFCVGK